MGTTVPRVGLSAIEDCDDIGINDRSDNGNHTEQRVFSIYQPCINGDVQYLNAYFYSLTYYTYLLGDESCFKSERTPQVDEK